MKVDRLVSLQFATGFRRERLSAIAFNRDWESRRYSAAGYYESTTSVKSRIDPAGNR